MVGGDFYDFFRLPDGPNGPRWAVVVADVADKGIPASLFMALSRTLLRSVAFSRIDPGQVLQRANDLIISDAQSDMFVSVIYGVWEPPSPASPSPTVGTIHPSCCALGRTRPC